MKPLTRDQIRASNPDASVWVSASAGTGKTHVLTARFLRLLLRGSDPSVILSLTYTRAAANEMSLRIYDELSQWPKLGDAQLAATIAQHTGEKPDQVMLERARTLFGLILDTPGGLKIQTLHAFCQSVLRRFPIEAGLSPGFEVLDERTSSELKADAVELVYAESRKNPKSSFALALRKIASEISEFSFENLLNAMMFSQRAIMRNLQHHGGTTGFGKAIQRVLDLNPGETKSDAVEQFYANLRPQSEILLSLCEVLSAGNVGESRCAKTLQALLGHAKNSRVHMVTVQNHAESLLADVNNAQKRRPRAKLLSKKKAETHPDIAHILEEQAAAMLSLLDRLDRISLAEHTSALVTLAERIFSHYRSLKQQRGYLDYDDLIDTTDRLFQQPGLAPWILYKLDDGIDHILVDEAQDTNRMQWRLLEAISDEFFAGEGAGEKLRTVFAVGDVKQSIYRFQGAAPREFTLARERIREKTKNARKIFQSEELKTSFRSCQAVLSLVDEVFKNPKAVSGLDFDDNPVEHRAYRTGQAGLVELWPTEEPDDDATSADWQLPVNQHWLQSGETKVATRIANKIQTLLEKGEKLPSRNREIEPGDFLILVRRRTPFVESLVRELKARNVPVSGADRMILNEQLVIEDMIALGAFVLLPDDDLNLANLLKSPIIGFNDAQLFALAYNRNKQSLWRLLRRKANDANVLQKTVEQLKKFLAVADYEAPFEFFSNILNQDKIRLKLARRLGNEINDPIDEFLNLALQYQKIHAPSLQGFIHWLSAKKTEIKRDLDQRRNEVRVMTIHGAKGLEAPIVFLPDTCSLPSDRNLIMEEDESDFSSPMIYWAARRSIETGRASTARELLRTEELAEQNRLLYVALTRAEDRLYITGWETSKKRPEDCWYNHIQSAFSRLEGVAIIEQSSDYRIQRLTTEQTVEAEPQEKETYPMGPAPSLPEWANSLPEPEKLPPLPLVPSATGNRRLSGLDPHQKGAKQAALRGEIIHSLLELLPDMEKASRVDKAAKYLAMPGFDLSIEEQSSILERVLAVLDHKDYGVLFGPNSRAEVPIVGMLAGRVVSGRIDRLVIGEKDILFVDFKSSRKPPASEHKIHSAIILQLAIYKAILEKIYPEKTIRAALLWTETATFMKVTNSILEHALKSVN